MSAYTPGPWRFTAGVSHPAEFSIRSNNDPEYTLHCQVCEWKPGTKEIAEANARLISAAPELLEALQKILEEYREQKRLTLMMANLDGPWGGSGLTVDDDIFVIAAKAAIAKAEGAQ